MTTCVGTATSGGTRGFTLLEILVVIVIIGVIVSIATLSTGVLGRDSQVEDAARRFWAVLQEAREEAELQGREAAVFVSTGAYEFLRFDQRRNQWLLIDDDPLYRARELAPGLRHRLWLDGREVVLEPELPDRSDQDEHLKQPPQVMVLSSGEIVPFELHLERDGAEALWRVTATAENDLRVERRDADRQWTIVAQTRIPETERVSNAR
jgi:general secretion pathway protein H